MANEVLNQIKKSINKNIISKNIHVYGWQKEYDHKIITSVSKYLFETLQITENIAPLTNENREGKIKPKYYVTIHDTGDALDTHTAKFWSETVYAEKWEQGPYACSYQYVTGNDGIYHNIPDNEVAWHAGDGTAKDYTLYVTDIEGSNPYPVITISEDGYYVIDGKKSIVLAPRAHKERNGEVIYDRVSRTEDINEQGILCKLIDGKYYLGETYYSASYGKIANRGGNNNSIGIESCINEGTDIYLTWQRTAKLTANLLYNNNLTFDDVKQHHYFSGKNCPQTIRMNGMWEHFMSLVKCEYEMILYLRAGYSFKLCPMTDNIMPNGRIKDDAINDYKFIIEIYKGNQKIDEIKFTI